MKLDMSMLDGGKLASSTHAEAGGLQDVLSSEGLAQQFPLPAVKDVSSQDDTAAAAKRNQSFPSLVAVCCPDPPARILHRTHPQHITHCMHRMQLKVPSHLILSAIVKRT